MPWKPAGDDTRPDTCPRCHERTEWLMVVDSREDDGEEHEYLDAERCRNCGWEVRFDA